MYKYTFAPADGSDAAKYVVEQAVDLAPEYGTTIHALYAVGVGATSCSLGTEQIDRIRQGHLDDVPEAEDAANVTTGCIAAAAAEHGLAVRGHVVPGEPARAIRKFAEDNDTNLIVVDSHGRSDLPWAVLGSMTEHIFRRTRLPVLVVSVHEKKVEAEVEADA